MGHIPRGCVKEWHIWHEKSFLGSAVPFRRDGYGRWNNRSLCWVHANILSVGEVTKTLYCGEGIPPATFMFRRSTVAEVINSSIAASALRWGVGPL